MMDPGKMRKPSCLVCGSPLVYLEEVHIYTCEVCGGRFDSDAACRQGHYICDACDSAREEDLIEKVCLNSKSTRPVELAVSLMNMMSIARNGPVSHFLVPAVLLSAYHNQLGDAQEKERTLRMARQRARDVVGNFCGFYGVCSMGIATGIFISLIADSSPLADGAWELANQMTTETLRRIESLEDPRCCKRDTFLAIQTARWFAQQNLQIELDVPDAITCEFSFYNQDCHLEEICPFRPLEK